MKGAMRAIMVGDDRHESVTHASRALGISRPTIKRALDTGKPLKSSGLPVTWADPEPVDVSTVDSSNIASNSVDSSQVEPVGMDEVERSEMKSGDKPLHLSDAEPDESIPAGMTKAQLQWTANVILCAAQNLIEDAQELNERAKQIEES